MLIIRSLIPLVLICALPTAPISASAQVAVVTVAVAPPELPVYVQPPMPGHGYIWTPGYWAHGVDGYYWVPGVWIIPPAAGLLWTPPYWAWRNGVYAWHAGYWGPRVGFYGGINYGYGYSGVGYAGGYWRNGVFMYNRTVNNFGTVKIVNVYSKTVVINRTERRVSYNGGPGGTGARASAAELTAARGRRIPATVAQTRHVRAATINRVNLFSVNRGKPPATIAGNARRVQTGASKGATTGNVRGSGVTSPKTVTHNGSTDPTKVHGRATSPKSLHPTGRMPAPGQLRSTGRATPPKSLHPTTTRGNPPGYGVAGPPGRVPASRPTSRAPHGKAGRPH
jgi:hypothetical protein